MRDIESFFGGDGFKIGDVKRGLINTDPLVWVDLSNEVILGKEEYNKLYTHVGDTVPQSDPVVVSENGVNSDTDHVITDTGRIITTSVSGLQISDDGGVTQVNKAPWNGYLVAALGSNVVAVGYGNSESHYSSDFGDSWVDMQVETNVLTTSAMGLKVLEGRFFLLSQNSIWWSDTGAPNTWSEISLTTPAIDITYGNGAYYIVTNYQIYKNDTHDGTPALLRTDTQGDHEHKNVVVVGARIIVSDSYTGELFYSDDIGVNWAVINPTDSATGAAIKPIAFIFHAGFYYLYGSGGMFRGASIDGAFNELPGWPTFGWGYLVYETFKVFGGALHVSVDKLYLLADSFDGDSYFVLPKHGPEDKLITYMKVK